jgi:histidine ammonia-lyase
VTSKPMSLRELLDVAGGARIELDASAIAAIKESRAVVDSVLASGRAVYGLNMGLGHMKDTRLPDAQLKELQETMIEGHAGAIGPSLPAQVVRAAMAARVNGMARGGAGVTLACAETYVAMLNAGIHPIVPSFGSVGASDLAQMAAIAKVAIGRGEAEYKGEIMPGAEALRRAAITPLRLEPKDGLALMSANAISVGHGAMIVARAMEALELADLAAVLSLEAMSGNATPFDAEVAAAKGVEGQVRVSEHIRGLIEGSGILDDDPTRSVQDALSFRVVPQVHGALWEFIELARRSVEAELNAMTDNPLVSRKERRMISNGNFHPMLVALSFDALRPALAHPGQLSDRRMNHLWAATFAKSADANRSVWGSTADMRGTSLRYAAAAAAAELRQMANPASLDVGALDLGIEDHATGAPIGIDRTDLALIRLQDILAVELLMARDLLMVRRGDTRPGAGAMAVMASLNEELKLLGPAAESRQFHAATIRVMRDRLLGDAGKSSPRLSWAG